MRIVYDHSIFTRQSYGGISRYFREITLRVGEAPDTEAVILAPAHRNRYLEADPRGVRGVHIPPLRGFERVRPALNDALSRAYLSLMRPDIVHETYYRPDRLSPRSCAAVLTVYDMTHERFPEFFPESSVPAWKRAAAERSEQVICISEFTRNEFLSLTGYPPDRTSVTWLGHGLPPAGEKPSVEEPYLLFVGFRDGYKNFDALLRAYAASPRLMREFRLVCFGGMPLSPAECPAGVGEDRLVWFSGDDRLLSTLYAHAAAFVYPSRYEGFGIPLLEAMSRGCPVICSGNTVFPEVAGDAAAYFHPENPEDLRATLERVVFSPSERRELIERGRERAERFSWDACASRTLEIYRTLR